MSREKVSQHTHAHARRGMRTGDRARRGEITHERDGRVNLLREPPPIRREAPVGWGPKLRHVVGRPELLQQAQNASVAAITSSQQRHVWKRNAARRTSGHVRQSQRRTRCGSSGQRSTTPFIVPTQQFKNTLGHSHHAANQQLSGGEQHAATQDAMRTWLQPDVCTNAVAVG
jgi:hypothetical protein